VLLTLVKSCAANVTCIHLNCRTVKGYVLDREADEDDDPYTASMWQAIDFLKAVFEPIHSLLRRTDNRAPMMGKFYKLISDLGGQLDELFDPPSKWSAEPWCNYKESISQIHLDRWNYMHCPYHAAGYALDPAYLADDVAGINDGEVMTCLVQVIEQIHYNDEQARATALMQFNEFRSQSGIFGMPASQQYAKQVPAH
jgi:hypothetical protein